MSGYVGMDVHHKRSQVAIVDAAGVPQRNRNLATTRPRWSQSLACWRPGPGGVRGRLRLGLAGRAVGRAGAGAAPGPSQPRQSDRLGPAAERQGRCGHPGQLLRADLLPRPGSHPSRSGICGPCCVTGPAWSGCRPCARTGSMRCWPTAALGTTPACGLVLGGPGWPTLPCRQPHGRSSRTAIGLGIRCHSG